jgi:hypothetical protein
LNRSEPLWPQGLHNVYLYYLDGMQTKKIAGGGS